MLSIAIPCVIKPEAYVVTEAVGVAVGATVGEVVGVAEGVLVGAAVVGVALGVAVTAAAAATVTLRTLSPFHSVKYTLSLLSTATPLGVYRFAAVA